MDLKEPWLVAAWPGMGAVALLAADYLSAKLGAQAWTELPGGEHFLPERVDVQDGILQPSRAPRTVLSRWRHPSRGRDLIVLRGEQQPSRDAWRYCQAVLDLAQRSKVSRVYTFAAMATPSAPTAPSRVFAAATDADCLAELRRLGAEPVDSGEIGGLNGVFLAAAEGRRLPGACLLAEIPYFASAVPNPKAAAAALRVFAKLAGIDLDLTELEVAGADVERQLAAHLEKMEQAARAIQEAAARKGAEEAGESPEEWASAASSEEPTPADLRRVEALFEEARRDRSRAMALKAELDRLGVFERYEDRFLDLFKRAE
jgi:hypothetical protein